MSYNLKCNQKDNKLKIIQITEEQFKDIMETVISGVVNVDIIWQEIKNIFFDKKKSEIMADLHDPVWDNHFDQAVKCAANEIYGLLEDEANYGDDGYRNNIRTVLRCLKQKNYSNEELKVLRERFRYNKKLKQLKDDEFDTAKKIVASFNQRLDDIKRSKEYEALAEYRHKYNHRHSLKIADVFIKYIRIVSDDMCKLASDIYHVFFDMGNACKIYNNEELGRVTFYYLDKGIEVIKLIRSLEFDELNKGQEKDVVERILNLDIHNHKCYNIKSIDMGYTYGRRNKDGS